MKLALILALLLSVPPVVRWLCAKNNPRARRVGWKYKSCSGLSAFYCSVLCCKLISAPLGEDCIKTIVSCNFGLPLTALMGCYSGNAKWVDISFCLHASFPRLLQKCLVVQSAGSVTVSNRLIRPGSRANEAGACIWRATEVQISFSEGDFGQDSITPIPNKSSLDGPAPLLCTDWVDAQSSLSRAWCKCCSVVPK